MAWLVTHMWMVLAGATVFALMLGWSVRGMLLTGKMRKAIVDKDVALTELDQARDEIERLFAAQRAQRGEGGGVADASARKISDLTAELQKAKTELTTLRSEAAKAASAPRAEPATERDAPTIVLPPSRGGLDEASEEAGTPAAESEAAEPPTLTWRNRHLEARVKHLEAQLAEIEAAPAADAEPAAVVTEDAPAAQPALSVDEEGLAKLKWQADYLKQRVEALESELAKAPAEVPVVTDEDANEEMARLRWRNRFLEGRLAYFEGGADDAAAEPVAEKTGAEAMLEELEVTDTAADMTEAVEAMAEGLTVAELPDEAEPDFVEVKDEAPEEAAFETLAGTETVEVEVADEEDAAPFEEEAQAAFVEETAEAAEDEAPEAGAEEETDFEDVSDDEEESLAEADHADEDVLSDEEHDEADFANEDDGEDEYEVDADEADAFEDDAEEDGAEDDEDEESDEADDYDDEDESGDIDDEDADFEEEDFDEDDFEDDEDADTDEDEAYDDAEDEDDDDSHEEDDASDEAWDEAEDDVDEEDASAEADEDESSEEGVTYETDETIVPERPMAMNGPVEGHPDDLTLIGGIGPKIQVLLNELGVWHYDQIAEWTPENVAWMDEHLNFGGRITREGWVEQAAVLVRDAESV